MNLAHWLERVARSRPDAPALMTGSGVDADYRLFARRAAAVADGLAETFAVRPGDTVGLFMRNRVEYLEALLGIWWAGAAAVPINAKLHPKEAAWIVANSECRVVIVDESAAAALHTVSAEMPNLRDVVSVDGTPYQHWRRGNADGPPVARGPDDLAWLFYTSGTTGRPKGAMLTWGNLQAMALCYFADVASIAPTDASLYAAPISHGAGMYMLPHLRTGARHVVPESGGFEPAEILDLARDLRDLSLFAAPTMVRRLVDKAKTGGRDGDGFKTIVYGGGPMYLADIEDALAVMGPCFAQIFGQAECPMTITSLPRRFHADRDHPRFRDRLASVGTPMSAVRVRIADGDGAALPTGEVGHILVKGMPVMHGYWRDPKATAAAIRDGWLDTGDMGAMDDDGFLTLHDRSKDMIISGGSNIYPREIEEVLLQHPDIREAAVIGRPHPDWGEEVVACLVSASGTLDEAALDALCLDHIARFKRPRAYLAMEALPKNNYGKVLKTELRKRVAEPS